MGVYYDWSKIESYDCPVKCVIARRGIGKTFGKIKSFLEQFITGGHRFIYIVETGDMVKELARNRGEKFWSAILDYYSKQDSSRKRYFYSKITELNISDDDESQDEIFDQRKTLCHLIGGTIKINGETAGYIVDLNSFGEIKRNNFTGVRNILFDEFISEKIDKTTLDNPRKISSIIQSICRTRKDVRIYLAGNTVRATDSVLARLGFKLTKYGFYFKHDKYGLFMVLHYVDSRDYPEFVEKHNESVAGRFANMLGENHEEENTFVSDIPDNRLLSEMNFKKKGFSINIVKEDTIVTIRQLENGGFGCVPFSNNRVSNLYCMTEKEQGFKFGYHIICSKSLKTTILEMLHSNIIYYYSEIEYAKLKFIIKGD